MRYICYKKTDHCKLFQKKFRGS